MNASELLEPYRARMLDTRHWELTLLTLDWSLQRAFRQVEPTILAREAFFTSTFELGCSPRDATLEENLLGAKQITCFFKADDGPPEELSSFLASTEQRTVARTELQACHDDWLADMQRQGLETQAPREAFRAMCAAMREEKLLDKSTLTEAQYRSIRKTTVGVLAYVACWAAIRSLAASAPVSLHDTGLPDLTAELVYIVNDLGSLERDELEARQSPSGGELNLVLLKARETNSREEAVQQVVALYHEKLQDFRRLREELAGSTAWRERAVREHVELLRGVSNGNLSATRHLIAMRYPGSQARLEGLPEVEPLAAPA